MSPSPPILPGYAERSGDPSSRHVYVHHINERQPQPQTQPIFMPMPMPYPQPAPMPMFMGGMGGYGGYPQQPPVIVVAGKSGEGGGGGGEKECGGDKKKKEKEEKDGGGGGGEADDGKDADKGAKPCSSNMLASIIFCLIGSVLGFICVGKVYDVFEHSLESDYVSDYLVVNRQVALGIGAFGTLCYFIAFMLAFYAGMKYKMKSKKEKKKEKKKHKCCRDGLLIASIILFGLTFMNNLIILVLAFDEEARIFPEVALCAVFGSIAAWICVFGWAEMTRRS